MASSSGSMRGDIPRDTLVDIALGAFVIVVVATAITADLGSDSTSPDLLAYGIAFGLGALMLVRRQLPVPVALVTGLALIGYYMLDYPPVGLAVPVAAALYSVAEAGKLRWAIWIALALLVVSNGSRIATGDDLGYLFGFELATSVTLMAAVIALGDAVRSRRELRDEAERRVLAVALERSLDADRRVAQERLRISRDLHDVLAHTMSVITVQADVAAEAVDDEDAEAVRHAVDTIRGSARSASAEIRSTVQVLRHGDSDDAPATRDPINGLADLERLAEATRAAGVHVEVVVHGKENPLPLAVDVTALRIVQEALTNVRQHARASTARVSLDYAADMVQIEVTDDGVGTTAVVTDGAHSFGIRGMRERAELLGGTVDAGPLDGRGFRVAARLPVTR